MTLKGPCWFAEAVAWSTKGNSHRKRDNKGNNLIERREPKKQLENRSSSFRFLPFSNLFFPQTSWKAWGLANKASGWSVQVPQGSPRFHKVQVSTLKRFQVPNKGSRMKVPNKGIKGQSLQTKVPHQGLRCQRHVNKTFLYLAVRFEI